MVLEKDKIKGNIFYNEKYIYQQSKEGRYYIFVSEENGVVTLFKMHEIPFSVLTIRLNKITFDENFVFTGYNNYAIVLSIDSLKDLLFDINVDRIRKGGG